MRYSLAVFRNHPKPFVTIEVEGKYYALADLLPSLEHRPERGILDILDQWSDAKEGLNEAALRAASGSFPALNPAEHGGLDAPLLYPGKIICTGTNYYDHLRKDMGITDFDKSKYDILYFMKHQKAIVGSGRSVRYPSQSVQLDWEIELVVVFGKTGRRISVDQAMEHVAGYAVGMDLSARDWQFNPRHPKTFDLVGGKSFDDSSPLGPHFVPAEFIDLDNLELKLWVNGDLKQASSTNEMIWSVAEQIAELSQVMTIEAGDVLYTGSPGGVGFPSRTFLNEGDHIQASITGLGTLSVEIMPDPDETAARQL